MKNFSQYQAGKGKILYHPTRSDKEVACSICFNSRSTVGEHSGNCHLS
jgi:hypothetical protein